VFVTCNFHPDAPKNHEELAVVVRVESLGGGHIGVAIRIKSLLPKACCSSAQATPVVASWLKLWLAVSRRTSLPPQAPG